MCGRYSLTPTRKSIVNEFDVTLVAELDDVASPFERYNIAPTQPVAVIVPNSTGRMLTAMRWGIIPQWMKAKDGKTPAGWINARAETVASKPAFRGAYKYRRCLVPASGFYEWQKQCDGSKQPYLIRPADDGLLAFAGLWETWSTPDGSELDTVTILTTAANTMMHDIHDRMTVVLAPADYDRWLLTKPEQANELKDLLQPAPDGTLYKTPITRRVNSARNDDAGCYEGV